MLETSKKKWTIPAATVEKLNDISKKFGKLNTGSVGDELWLIVADDTDNDYEGSGLAVGINKNGELVQDESSHCSCYGNFEDGITANNPQKLEGNLTVEFDVYNNFDDWLPELKKTTNTLYEVLNGKKVKPKEVIALPNAELRRAVVEMIGYDKIIDEATLKDESADGKLYEIPLEEDENIVLVHVKDPSTDREYFLRVPPDMKSAKQARAWTFGFESDEFNLEKET